MTDGSTGLCMGPSLPDLKSRDLGVLRAAKCLGILIRTARSLGNLLHVAESKTLYMYDKKPKIGPRRRPGYPTCTGVSLRHERPYLHYSLP